MTRPGRPGARSAQRVAAAFGRRLAQHRRARGWKQQELGARAGIRVQRLSLLENGHNLPNVLELMRLREILSLSIDELVTGEPGPPRPVLLDVIERLESRATATELKQIERTLERWAVRLGGAGKGGRPE